jgi:hypothetical protein
LQAAAQKKHTPVEFTTDKSRAQYIASLSDQSKKGSTAHAVLMLGDRGARSVLSLSVSNPNTSTVVLA